MAQKRFRERQKAKMAERHQQIRSLEQRVAPMRLLTSALNGSAKCDRLCAITLLMLLQLVDRFFSHQICEDCTDPLSEDLLESVLGLYCRVMCYLCDVLSFPVADDCSWN